MVKMRDSNGNYSNTLGLIKIAFFVGTGAFIYGVYIKEAIDLISYGTFVTAILAPWIGREWIKSKKAV